MKLSSIALTALVWTAAACGQAAEETSSDDRQVTVSGADGLQLSVAPHSET